MLQVAFDAANEAMVIVDVDRRIHWANQASAAATVFGNTVFVFIYHHSIPGIIYPVRPQK